MNSVKDGLNERPAIVVGLKRGAALGGIVRETIAGIEEEQVQFELREIDNQDVVDLAYHAANLSRIGIGIGICEDSLVVHHSLLQKNNPLISLGSPDAGSARIAGANSARLAKGIPLK